MHADGSQMIQELGAEPCCESDICCDSSPPETVTATVSGVVTCGCFSTIYGLREVALASGSINGVHTLTLEFTSPYCRWTAGAIATMVAYRGESSCNEGYDSSSVSLWLRTGPGAPAADIWISTPGGGWMIFAAPVGNPCTGLGPFFNQNTCGIPDYWRGGSITLE